MSRVLIVEDNLALVAIWTEALTDEGFDVLHASDVEQAKTFLRDHSIDVAIVDLVMDEKPVPDAYQGLVVLADMFVRALDGVALRPRVIVASGYFVADNESVLKDRVLPFKPDRVLAKPVDLDFLIQNVRDLATATAA